MTKYYQLTDKTHQIYAAATFLNPTQRRDYFDNSWVGMLQPSCTAEEDEEEGRLCSPIRDQKLHNLPAELTLALHWLYLRVLGQAAGGFFRVNHVCS